MEHHIDPAPRGSAHPSLWPALPPGVRDPEQLDRNRRLVPIANCRARVRVEATGQVCPQRCGDPDVHVKRGLPDARLDRGQEGLGDPCHRREASVGEAGILTHPSQVLSELSPDGGGSLARLGFVLGSCHVTGKRMPLMRDVSAAHRPWRGPVAWPVAGFNDRRWRSILSPRAWAIATGDHDDTGRRPKRPDPSRRSQPAIKTTPGGPN